MALLEIEHLTKRFGGLVAVNDFSMHVDEGEIVGLIGPNGAGKTTVFNLIACYYPPTGGAIRFEGQSLIGLRPFEVCKRGLARTFQVTKPFGDMTVHANVMVGALRRTTDVGAAKRKATKICRFVGLADRMEVPSHDLNISNRKRLELARALATDPKVILLDEVMAGLNPREKGFLLDLLREVRSRGVTLVFVEHDMKAVVALCERVVMLNRGEKLVEGTPQEVARDERAIRAYLGEEYGAA